MVAEKMRELGTKRSSIREIFEFAMKRAALVGPENVYDFSIGNPNVPAPEYIKEAIIDIITNMPPAAVHSYTVAPGALEVRETLAGSINERFGLNISGRNLFMTSGAAAAITISFKALAEEGNEIVAFAPYFPEYKVFVESVGAKLVVVPAQVENFQIDFAAFRKLLTPHTKAVIVNSPNNPSGVIYSEETIKELAAVLREKSREYGHPIFIISDEPYREIAYDGLDVPYIPKYYDNTLVCYSYSKSFSLPGERIGYIMVPDTVEDFGAVYGAVAGAARVLTHVNASSLFQLVVARCAGKPSDISQYEKNGRLLYDGLRAAGIKCLKPQGAFYLFPQALEADDEAFCEKAKKYDLLFVPGSGFGCPGFARLAYCISEETIRRSLPVLKKFTREEYGVDC